MNPTQPQSASAPSDFELDLDALSSAGRKVRFGGKIITVDQPTTEQMFELITIGSKLESQTANNYDPEQLKGFMGKAADICGTLSPDLKDQKLNMAQTLALIQFVVGMTQTEQMKHLKEKGISAAEAPKGEAS